MPASGAGFTTGTPWIGINPDYAEVNVAAERADEGSVLHHYRRLIALRHQEPAVVHGDFTMLMPDDEQVYAFTRRHGDVELLVLVNVSGAEAAVEIPDLEDWSRSDLLLGTVPDAGGPAWPALLRPWEARVHRRRVAGR